MHILRGNSCVSPEICNETDVGVTFIASLLEKIFKKEKKEACGPIFIIHLSE